MGVGTSRIAKEETMKGGIMKSPAEVWQIIKLNLKKEWKTAFLAAFVIGLLIHVPMMVQDIPNHDGLDSMHFDQNMITSGRWFLTVACGISSYYTLPWLIGLLSILYLSLTSAALVEFLEVKKTWTIVLISGLVASFPAIASTFAYVFTMDGYMMALFLAVMSAVLTKKFRFGFVAGAVCLALSMGIYQAYLPVAVLLCIYGILMISMESVGIKEKISRSFRYLYMGIAGAAGYYIVLQILLLVQGKELASYQGIDGMGAAAGIGLLGILKRMYTDFFAFSLKGNVLINNIFSLAAVCVLAFAAAVSLVRLVLCKKWWRSPWLYVLIGLLAAGLPVATNLILLISPDVTYHVLMRYQWVLYPIILIAFSEKYEREFCVISGNESIDRCKSCREWLVLMSAGILVWNFAVTDNIAYSNLQKKYEKTYAYCVRLLDRIEQTEGYYQGIPIAMIGVVGEESYPTTDISDKVTSGLIGMNGDVLLYTGGNYELFIRHYLGASLNILPPSSMAEMYYSKEYREMESFPAKDSIRIIDGIMYIKTENKE